MKIYDQNGNQVEIIVSGTEDDIMIEEAYYVDLDEEVSEDVIEFIQDEYQSEIYENWIESRISESDFYELAE